jgi:hypothetical protein
MARNDDSNSASRDRYRDNDDVRQPASPDERNETAPDTRFEARGDARDAVGNNARGTDADPTGASGNDKTRSRSDLPDQYDEDLARDNRFGREGEGMSDLARDTRSGMAAEPDRSQGGEGGGSSDGRHFWRSHARQGQAESPVELNHNEPPRKKEGHQ